MNKKFRLFSCFSAEKLAAKEFFAIFRKSGEYWLLLTDY